MTGRLDVHPGLWDGWPELAGDAPMVGSAPWLAMRAPRVDGDTLTFTYARGRDAPNAGVFATVAEAGAADDAYDIRALLAGATRTAIDSDGPVGTAPVDTGAVERWYPHLSVAYPGYECFVAGPGRDDAGTVAGLVAAISEWAAAGGLTAVGFLYTLPGDAVLSAALRRQGFATTPSPYTAANDLRLAGDGFDDYLASLPRHHRTEIRRERRKVADAGITAAPVDLAAERAEVVGLRLQHAARYGRRVSEEKEQARLDSVIGAFGRDRVLGFGARGPGGELISFCVVVDWHDEWYVLDSGSDYDHPDHRLTYFEACYYTPIEAAYRRSVRTLHFGLGSWAAKRQRGCVETPRHVWVKALDPRLAPVVATWASAVTPSR